MASRARRGTGHEHASEIHLGGDGDCGDDLPDGGVNGGVCAKCCRRRAACRSRDTCWSFGSCFAAERGTFDELDADDYTECCADYWSIATGDVVTRFVVAGFAGGSAFRGRESVSIECDDESA